MANTPKGTIVKNRKTGDTLLASGLRTFDPAQFEIGASLPSGSRVSKAATETQGFLRPGETTQQFQARESTSRGFTGGARDPNIISEANIPRRGVTPGGGFQGFQQQQGQLNALRGATAPPQATRGVQGDFQATQATQGVQGGIDFTFRPGETPQSYQERITRERQTQGGITVEQALGVNPQDINFQNAQQIAQQATQRQQGGLQQPGGFQQPQGAQPSSTDNQILQDLEAQLRALQQTFTQALTPSEKELSVQQQLQNIITSAELGINKVREQPIATSFISGQSAAIQRQAATSARPLQTQLADIQARRQAAIDVGGAQLGFAESALERAEARLKQPAGFTLGEGQTRFDAQGNVIAQGQEAAEDFDLRTVGNQIIRINPQTGQSEVIFEGDAGDDPFTIQQKFTNTLSLRKEFNDESKDFIKIRDSFGRIQAVTQETSAAGDLALIFNYMKMLDPGSVVRESEFATAANSAGVPDRIRAQYNRVISGERLATNTRNDFLRQSENLFNSQLRQQKRLQADFQKQATDFQLDPNKVAPDLSSAIQIGGDAFSSLVEEDISDLDFRFQ